VPYYKMEVQYEASRTLRGMDISQLTPCLTAGQAELKLDSLR
jgi:hypothetical protein